MSNIHEPKEWCAWSFTLTSRRSLTYPLKPHEPIYKCLIFTNPRDEEHQFSRYCRLVEWYTTAPEDTICNVCLSSITHTHSTYGILSWYITVSTENATSPKSTASRNSDFWVSRGTHSHRDFGLILNWTRGIWVSAFDGSWGCSTSRGICHTPLNIHEPMYQCSNL